MADELLPDWMKGPGIDTQIAPDAKVSESSVLPDWMKGAPDDAGQKANYLLRAGKKDWGDQSKSMEARLNDYHATALAAKAVPEQFAEGLKNHLGIVPSPGLMDAYKKSVMARDAAESAANVPEGDFERFIRHYVPFGTSMHNAFNESQYRAAKDRIEGRAGPAPMVTRPESWLGRRRQDVGLSVNAALAPFGAAQPAGDSPTDDYDTVARYEHLNKLDESRSFGAKFMDEAVGGAARMAGEAVVGGAVVPGGAATSLLGKGGHLAGKTALMPSLYVDPAERKMSADPELSAGKAYGSEFLYGMAQNAILGKMSAKVGGGTGFLGKSARVPVATGAGMAEQAGLDIGASAIDDLAHDTVNDGKDIFGKRYGLAGAFARNDPKKWEETALQASTFAMFSMLHAAHGDPRLGKEQLAKIGKDTMKATAEAVKSLDPENKPLSLEAGQKSLPEEAGLTPEEVRDVHSWTMSAFDHFPLKDDLLRAADSKSHEDFSEYDQSWNDKQVEYAKKLIEARFQHQPEPTKASEPTPEAPPPQTGEGRGESGDEQPTSQPIPETEKTPQMPPEASVAPKAPEATFPVDRPATATPEAKFGREEVAIPPKVGLKGPEPRPTVGVVRDIGNLPEPVPVVPPPVQSPKKWNIGAKVSEATPAVDHHAANVKRFTEALDAGVGRDKTDFRYDAHEAFKGSFTTPEASRLHSENVKGVRVFESVPDLNTAIRAKRAAEGITGEALDRYFHAAYDMKNGVLYLDGHEAGVAKLGFKELKDLYRHETGHSVMGDTIPDGFADAHAKELADGQLTKQAAKRVEEGFAEVYRLLATKKPSMEAMRKAGLGDVGAIMARMKLHDPSWAGTDATLHEAIEGKSVGRMFVDKLIDAVKAVVGKIGAAFGPSRHDKTLKMMEEMLTDRAKIEREEMDRRGVDSLKKLSEEERSAVDSRIADHMKDRLGEIFDEAGMRPSERLQIELRRMGLTHEEIGKHPEYLRARSEDTGRKAKDEHTRSAVQLVEKQALERLHPKASSFASGFFKQAESDRKAEAVSGDGVQGELTNTDKGKGKSSKAFKNQQAALKAIDRLTDSHMDFIESLQGMGEREASAAILDRVNELDKFLERAAKDDGLKDSIRLAQQLLAETRGNEKPEAGTAPAPAEGRAGKAGVPETTPGSWAEGERPAGAGRPTTGEGPDRGQGVGNDTGPAAGERPGNAGNDAGRLHGVTSEPEPLEKLRREADEAANAVGSLKAALENLPNAWRDDFGSMHGDDLKDLRRRFVDELVEGWHDEKKSGNSKAAAVYENLLETAGAVKVGTNGQTVPFIAAHHASDSYHAPDAPVRVVQHGYGLKGEKATYIARKAEVEGVGNDAGRLHGVSTPAEKTLREKIAEGVRGLTDSIGKGVRGLTDPIGKMGGHVLKQVRRVSEDAANKMAEHSAAKKPKGGQLFAEDTKIKIDKDLAAKGSKPTTSEEVDKTHSAVIELRHMWRKRTFEERAKVARADAQAEFAEQRRLESLLMNTKSGSFPSDAEYRKFASQTESALDASKKAARAHLATATDAEKKAQGVTSFFHANSAGKQMEQPKDFPFKTQKEATDYIQSPRGREIYDAMAKHQNDTLNKNYAEGIGLDLAQPIWHNSQLPNGPVYNEINLDKQGNPTGGPGDGSVFKANRKKYPFASEYAASSERVETSWRKTMENSYTRGHENVTKQRAFDALIEAGQAVVSRDKGGVEVDGKPAAVTLEYKKDQHGDMQYIHFGEKVKDDVRQLWGPDKAARLGVLTDASNAFTGVQTLGTGDMFSHGRNVLSSALIGIAPKVVPFLDFARNAYAKYWRSDAYRAKLMEGVRSNYMKETGYDSQRGLEKAIDRLPYGGGKLGRAAKAITGLTGKALDAVDEIARVTVADGFDQAAKAGWFKGTPEAMANMKRDLVNAKTGNYDAKTQSMVVNWLRQTGVQPFGVAHFGFAVNSARGLVGSHGVPAASHLAGAKMRAESLGKVAVLAGVGMLMNYIINGNPWGDDATPLGHVKLGTKNGKTLTFNLMGLSMVPRGLREIGALAQIEGSRRGDSQAERIHGSLKDVGHTGVGALAGPAVGFGWMAARGQDTLGRQIADTTSHAATAKGKADAARKGKVEDSPFAQELLNLEAALAGGINSNVAGLTGYDKTAKVRALDKSGTLDNLPKLLGPFNPLTEHVAPTPKGRIGAKR